MLLANSLSRGHRRVAIRRFLMLVACGFDVPVGYKEACKVLGSTCPAGELRRIQASVQAWVDMVSAPPLDCRHAVGVPVDKFAHLHDISRPTPRGPAVRFRQRLRQGSRR